MGLIVVYRELHGYIYGSDEIPTRYHVSILYKALHVNIFTLSILRNIILLATRHKPTTAAF